jgi:mannose-6-phosphate isomerase-like protein (cupin superfamily)
MDDPSTTVSFPCAVRKRDCRVLKVLGASIQFLAGPHQDEDAPCILKRTIPPGVSVLMHSHDVIEVFFVLSGNFEVLIGGGGKMRWIEVSAGNLIEVPSNAKHAFRNRSQHPVINLVFTTSKHGRYFQEIGRPAASRESIRPPTLNEIQHFVKTAERYGYWLATPEENASVGIRLPQFTHQKFSGVSAAA